MNHAEKLESLIKKIKGNIAKTGWSAISIFPDRENGVPGYSYTMGFAEESFPELIIMGLAPEIAHRLLADVYHTYVKADKNIPVNKPVEGIIKGYSVTFIEVSQANLGASYFKVWRELYGGNPNVQHKALQLVWPDNHGNPPWSPNFEEHLKSAQPLLGDSPVRH